MNALQYITELWGIIEARRAAGFPIARELIALVGFIMNPRELTDEEWDAHNKAQEEARELRRNAQPKDA